MKEFHQKGLLISCSWSTTAVPPQQTLIASCTIDSNKGGETWTLFKA